MAGGLPSTQCVTVLHVEEDGATHWEVAGACRELDAAFRGGGGGGGSADAGATMAHLQALLALCKQLRALL